MHGGMACGGPVSDGPARTRGAPRERLGVVAPGHRRFSNQSKAWLGGCVAGRRRFGMGEAGAQAGEVLQVIGVDGPELARPTIYLLSGKMLSMMRP